MVIYLAMTKFMLIVSRENSVIYLLCQTYGPYTSQVHSIIKSLGVTKKDRQNPHSHNVVKNAAVIVAILK